ncbi:MAG: KEOPS complex subunit Cgi121 [Nitrososphaeria archaeon]
MTRDERENNLDDLSLFCYGIRLGQQTTISALEKDVEKETGAVIQVLSSKFILDRDHAALLLYQSYEAYVRGISIARKRGIDILLRALCTRKIDKALKDAKGDVKGREYAVLGFCHRSKSKIVEEKLRNYGELDNKILEPSPQKTAFLTSYHNLTDSEIQNYNLVHLLCEKSASGLARYYRKVRETSPLQEERLP